MDIVEFSFRAYAGAADRNVMLEIRKQSELADELDPLSTCEDAVAAKDILSVVDEDNVHDRLVFMVTEGETIGYSQLSWWRESDNTQVYLHKDWILPAYRSPESFACLLAEAQKYLRALAWQHGAKSKAVFATNATEHEQCRAESLLADGYFAVWTMVEMEFSAFAGLTPAVVPDGVTISTPHPSQYREIWETNTAVYDGAWGLEPASEESYRYFARNELSRPDLCDVAWNKQQLMGFVLSTVQKGVGVVLEVTTARNYQRKGISRALLTRNLARFPEQGTTVVRLHTDANNGSGARSLYEKVGFRPLKLHVRYRKPLLW